MPEVQTEQELSWSQQRALDDAYDRNKKSMVVAYVLAVFFGMLGAQLGVIVATFAMAARNRNLLWSLAAAAGVLAIVFAIYVYLYV